MKHNSLYIKFLLGYLVFGLLAGGAVSALSGRLLYRHILAERAEAMYDEANLIAGSYSNVYKGSGQDLNSVYPQLQAVAELMRVEIWLVNRQGVLVIDSAGGGLAGMVIEGFDPAAGGGSFYTISDYYGLFSEDVISVLAPITGNYNTYGYVIIHLPLARVVDEADGFLNIIYISAGVIFLLSLIILLVFTTTVYLPLRRITAGAREYAAGNFGFRINVGSRDEIGYLAATLNYMSDELGRQEEYQRSFIANVSHDFRSPLTSIRGYLEAILDGTIQPEFYGKYLKRVIAETERLTKLTQDLLTLSSLDSKGYLNRTNFDINRVIRDTAAAFEGICGRRGIVFELTFSDEIEMVNADLGKIQQVLYNLIDNAVKFSYDGGTIYIQVTPRNEKVYVSVRDRGQGIARDSIKKIWDRFYKSDTSRGRDKKGTGLGLSIVKEIIQDHGETIDVISTEGVGSEFIFSLSQGEEL